MEHITLDGKPLPITEGLLPALIHYPDNVGGSHFSLVLLTHLIIGGSKALFLTGYPMATDSLLEMIGGQSISRQIMNSADQLQDSEVKQVVMINSGNEGLFRQALDTLSDIHERVIFVKNFDVFSQETIVKTLQHQKIILSGDLDISPHGKDIWDKEFKTQILFAEPSVATITEMPELEKYHAYFQSGDKVGVVKLEINSD